jgi:hypothetical protein
MIHAAGADWLRQHCIKQFLFVRVDITTYSFSHTVWSATAVCVMLVLLLVLLLSHAAALRSACMILTTLLS